MIPILYEDEHLLFADKPPGMETINKGKGACLSRTLREQTGCAALTPCHRLDRDTTGVQLFAKTADALHAAEDLFRHRKTAKMYLALTHGAPFNAEGTIRRNLSKWTGGHRPVQVVKGKGGLTAETAYRVLGKSKSPLPCGLLLFLPHHGRTHQIRVHAESLKRPILGDDQYGDRPANKQAKEIAGLTRQALHAWRLSFAHPITNEPLRIEAPLPADMVALATACGMDPATACAGVEW